jgi:RimJ/RimL family protein N-acetyltransferase
VDRIVINDMGHGERIARLSGTIFNPRGHQVVSRMKDGELLGGVIFTDYTRASITVHMAGFVKNWANRDLIWCVFHYAFEQLGVKKIFGQVPASNEEALQIDLKLGFSIETRVKDVFVDGDLIVVSMYRDQCRWLKLKPRGLSYAGGQ